MNNGIIETIGELIDNRDKELECFGVSWELMSLPDCNWGNLENQIDEGFIRVKPATITLYEYEHTANSDFEGDILWRSNACPILGYTATGRSIVSAPIVGDL